MQPILDAYSRLLTTCYEQRALFNEQTICADFMNVGKHYAGKLMVVGRAQNGSAYDWNKDEEDGYQWIRNDVLPRYGTSGMSWVAENVSDEGNYNSNRSAFWRAVRRLACFMVHEGPDCLEYVAHCNLYRITPESGNPGPGLRRVQFPGALALLVEEFEHFKPKNVVFFTGWGYSAPVVEALNLADEISVEGLQFIDLATRWRGRNLVFTQHPQGKPTEEHVAEILRMISQLNALHGEP